jgi:hypothetical protein
VKGQHDCVQAEVLDGTRYWAVQVLPSTHRTVEDLVNYFKELEC